jgi:energy-coupling factor transporter ATP-binding protein EcfA2
MTTKSFPFVDAIYRSSEIAAHKGNPFIEALPALPSDMAITLALTYLPPFDTAERQMDAPERIQRLELLSKLFVALPRIVRLARAMMKMMISGYGQRRPHSAGEADVLRGLYALQQSGAFVSAAQSNVAAQLTMALVGASGCGKSFSINHITNLFPPAIYHETLGKWQLPFLVIEMSYDGESVNTLATRIYEALQRILPDGNYVETYTQRSKNAEQRLANAFLVAQGVGVGQVVVDESQNQRGIGNDPAPARKGRAPKAKPKLKEETPLMKLLITASNTSKIPMVFTGTLEMKSVVGSRFTLSRRMSGHGSAEWHPFDPPTGDVKLLGEFDILLMAFFKYQWVRIPIIFSKHWADLFYELSQGIPDVFVKMFESAQEAAIASGLETLTEVLVRAVAAKEFIAVEFGVKALRTGDRVMLDAVTDLFADRSAPASASAGPPASSTGTPNAVTAPPAKSPATQPSAEKPAKEQPKAPTPTPFDAKLLAAADIRLDEDGQPPAAATALTLSDLVGSSK